MVRQRVRIRFAKTGDLRLISHRDLVRTFERLFRRAGLPLSMSEGFHPKPRMSFPSALAVGIAGTDEVMELELSAESHAERLVEALRPHLPPGLSLLAVEIMPQGVKKAVVRHVMFEIPVPAERQGQVAERVAGLMAAASCVIQRDEGRGPVDVRSFIDHLALVDGTLKIGLAVNPDGSARPREVLLALGVLDLETQGLPLSRTAVELET